jgi:hypothetical protein
VFDGLIKLINSSTKLAFALVFGGVAVFVGQYFGKWPFTLLQQEQLGFVLYGGLVGAGVLIFQAARLSWVLTVLAYWLLRTWLTQQHVMSRVTNLTLEQQADLLWIAHHPRDSVEGSPLEESFRGLLKHGFIFLTDEGLFKQAFKVNRRVYKNKKKLGANFSPEIYEAIIKGEAPWKRRQRSPLMRG